MHVTLGVGRNWFDNGVSVRNDGQYMAGLAYDLTQTVKLDASYSRKVRYPTLQELFDAQKGNSNLKPEESDDFEAGVTWRPRTNARIRLSVFQNHVANFIQNDKTTQTYANKNIRVSGFEITSKVRVLPNFDVGGGYTYLQTTDESTGLPVSYRPRDVVQLNVGYRPVENWAVRGWLNYVADQVVSAKNDPYDQMRMPDYVVANLRVSRLFPRLHGRLYVEADNLFNESYSYAVGLPAPGLMIYGGAEFGF
jgi:vitamin B12 transporter